jgi:hypothetical protein
MTKAISFLRTDLTRVDQATNEATISVVIAFTMVAFILGDIDSTKTHLHGLLKLVAMRGGLRSFIPHSYLQTKCYRLVPI